MGYICSKLNIPAVTGMNPIKFWTNIHNFQIIKPKKFGDSLHLFFPLGKLHLDSDLKWNLKATNF